MITTHKIEIKPNDFQKSFLSMSCGTSRYAYNMSLDLWNKEYLLGNKPNFNSINKQINKIKPEWSYKVSKCCFQTAIKDLDKSFKNFFNNKEIFNHPVFKKKGEKESFRLDNESFKLNGNKLKISRLKTEIRLTEELRFEGKILNCTISRKADKWFASIAVEIQDIPKTKTNREPIFVGVDLGLKTLAVCSDGVIFDNIKPHKNKLQKLRKLNKSLSRKKIGSKNFKKSKVKLSRLHMSISNIRNDYLHKTTTSLVRENDVICIEDLNASGMSKNRKLSRSILDVSFGTFKTMLTYKCERNNVVLIKADRFYPSTKTCSSCGNIQDMKLSDRIYDCKVCKKKIDRDFNASINLRNYAVGCTVKGFGLESSGTEHRVKLSKMKKQGIKKGSKAFFDMFPDMGIYGLCIIWESTRVEGVKK